MNATTITAQKRVQTATAASPNRVYITALGKRHRVCHCCGGDIKQFYGPCGACLSA